MNLYTLHQPGGRLSERLRRRRRRHIIKFQSRVVVGFTRLLFFSSFHPLLCTVSLTTVSYFSVCRLWSTPSPFLIINTNAITCQQHTRSHSPPTTCSLLALIIYGIHFSLHGYVQKSEKKEAFRECLLLKLTPFVRDIC